jgi:ribosomal protein L40E
MFGCDAEVQCSLPLLTSVLCSIPTPHCMPLTHQNYAQVRWSSAPIEFEFAGDHACDVLGLETNVLVCCRCSALSSPAHFSVVQHSHATLHATDPPKLRASGHPHQSNLNSLDHACDVLGLETNVLVCCRCSALFPSSLQIS